MIRRSRSSSVESLFQPTAGVKLEEKAPRIASQLLHQKNTAGPGDDADYLLDNVIFRVQGRMFKVPRYSFERSSEVFADMFALPTKNRRVEGRSIDNPIVLEEISSDDFEQLLKWVSVLKLSTQWRFLDVRRLAIQQLHTRPDLGGVERVMLGRQYGIVSFIRIGYVVLVRRTEVLSTEEAQEIGWDTAFHLSQLREKAAKSTVSPQEVVATFEEELKSAQSASAAYPSDSEPSFDEWTRSVYGKSIDVDRMRSFPILPRKRIRVSTNS
ncbi:hypothetical protein R3P38DRAFT_1055634 [Favolaschia claudopus]|uniref:BTB domain-containing protein n=1 Tax=Favolaschia claudopus TaxID=2862362 RepID=A0AAW0BGD6_9AGAR